MGAYDFLQPGSSPHTRGARVQPVASRHEQRIIPAYAGSTGTTGSLSPRTADHPRIRGEHEAFDEPRDVAVGSSPHTRGARGPDHDRDRAMGIIPAYAGSTLTSPARVSARRDHPRIRGEHQGRSGGRRQTGGSSPHTRGARHGDRLLAGCRRIIPAYAGST